MAASKLWTFLAELRAAGSQRSLSLLRQAGDWAASGAQVAQWLEEDWPEAIAWIVVAAGPFYLLRLVVRRPRLCAAMVSLWSSWLALQVLTKGRVVVEQTHQRGLTAMQATREVVQKSVVAVEAWIVVFLPFVSDMWRKSRAIWHVLSFRTKVVLVAGPVGLYLLGLAVKRLLDAFHRRRSAMKRIMLAVLFHGSFLLACPVLWYFSGFLSPNWQHLCLRNFLTTVPTLGSLYALGWRPAPKFAELLALEAPAQHLALPSRNGAQASPGRRRASASGRSGRPAASEEPMEFQASASTQRFWLSYWAAWPLLVSAEQGLPYLLELLDVPEVDVAQAHLRRGLLIFVIWLQLWQGSRLQLALLRHVLGRMPDTWPSMGNLPVMHYLQVLRSGVTTPSFNLLSMLQAMFQQRWRLLAAGVAGAILLALMVIAFYTAVSFANRVLVMLLWVFAACDSADTLAHGHESMLARKLAFWSVAMLWTWLSQLPVVGTVLRLFTPIVFALLMAAGETILKRVVQPGLDLAMKPLLRVLCGPRLYLARRMKRAARVVCSPLRLARQADVAEESAAETSAVPPAASLALPEAASASTAASSSAAAEAPPAASLALPEAASASTAASSSAAAEAPGETLVAARSPAESRRSSTASVNGASASGMAASPETKTPNLRHRKKGKNKR
ncbi:unnamed protein product [Cladocopium goreaui]|uniref:Uncharacterized protein n=1 Tax=Cladocopium goreaui TaxID=2562237 RepID=A0A9P1CR42_9DINO|nr:unnamed protein product [Cladocopium goreaui]